jgi:hypothetical protein
MRPILAFLRAISPRKRPRVKYETIFIVKSNIPAREFCSNSRVFQEKDKKGEKLRVPF